MDLFSQMGDEYEQVVWCHDPPTGLRAIVAIHSTALGPALGGTRFYPYGSESEAVTDVLRLARGMTYKSALAGLDLGGGKAVILGDPRRDKNEALLRAYGRFVDSLGGRYLTAEDVGTTQADMDVIFRETRCVTGVSPGLGGSGDPSEATAIGVWWAMRAVAEHLAGASSGSPGTNWGDGDGGNVTAHDRDGDSVGGRLEGMHVVISGVGKVGRALARLVVRDGAKLTVADTDQAALDRLVGELGVATTTPRSAHTLPCDIFSPCALGGVLNPTTIPQLACRAVVGCANNQLATAGDAALLDRRGILYAPDFVVNAGGVINIADELAGYQRERALAAVRHIGTATGEVLTHAAEAGITTVEAAEALAQARISAVGRVKSIRNFPRRP